MCTLVTTEERLGSEEGGWGRMGEGTRRGPGLRLGNEEWLCPRTLMPHVTDQNNRLREVSTCSVLKLQVAVREYSLPSQLPQVHTSSDGEKGAMEEEQPGSHWETTPTCPEISSDLSHCDSLGADRTLPLHPATGGHHWEGARSGGSERASGLLTPHPNTSTDFTNSSWITHSDVKNETMSAAEIINIYILLGREKPKC